MTAPIIPAGAGADLAALLLQWRSSINDKLAGAVVVKGSDQSRNTTTTYADDNTITLPVVANGIYEYRFHAGMTAGATPQIKTQIVAPTGSTMRGGFFMYNATTGAVSTASNVQSVAGMTGTDFYFMMTGLVIVGSTAGNVKLQWAQVVSNAANVTVHKGSCLILARLS